MNLILTKPEWCIHSGYVLNDPEDHMPTVINNIVAIQKRCSNYLQIFQKRLRIPVIIAKRCNLTLELNKSYFPNFPIPSGMTTEDFLIEEAVRG